MRTVTDHKSLGWIGAKHDTQWAGAVNPLPSDFVIGAFDLTLTNVVVGSAIQIETQAGATIVNRTATGTTEVFSLSAYKSGSAYNDLRIKVRKGTGTPYYRPYETLTTAFVGAQSIYVSQIQDD